MKAREIYEYNKLTWPEMNDAIELGKVVLLPTGSTEQHGAHLPLDTDLFLVESVCQELGRRAPDKVLVLPGIPYGLNMHHFDFPGTIHVEPQHFIDFSVDVLKSVAYHGFRRMAVINGHGSNMPMADLIARRVVLETPAICCAFGYYNMGRDESLKGLESGVYAHADEWETSLYLHFAADRVQMDKAVAGHRPGRADDDLRQHDQRPLQRLLGPVDQDGRPRRSHQGQPREGPPDRRGHHEGDAGLARGVPDWPIEGRQDQHRLPVQREIRW